MKQGLGYLIIGSIGFAMSCGGCATPRLSGAVVPMEEGRYQSVVKREEKESALKAFDSDAKVTCGKPGLIPGKVEGGKYAIESQSIKETAAKEADSSGSEIVDFVAKLKFGERGTKGTYEISTVFRCLP